MYELRCIQLCAHQQSIFQLKIFIGFQLVFYFIFLSACFAINIKQ